MTGFFVVRAAGAATRAPASRRLQDPARDPGPHSRSARGGDPVPVRVPPRRPQQGGAARDGPVGPHADAPGQRLLMTMPRDAAGRRVTARRSRAGGAAPRSPPRPRRRGAVFARRAREVHLERAPDTVAGEILEPSIDAQRVAARAPRRSGVKLHDRSSSPSATDPASVLPASSSTQTRRWSSAWSSVSPSVTRSGCRPPARGGSRRQCAGSGGAWSAAPTRKLRRNPAASGRPEASGHRCIDRERDLATRASARPSSACGHEPALDAAGVEQQRETGGAAIPELFVESEEGVLDRARRSSPRAAPSAARCRGSSAR